MSRRLSTRQAFLTALNFRLFFCFFENSPSRRPGPADKHIVFPDAGHPMWYQKPAEWRQDLETVLAKAGVR